CSSDDECEDNPCVEEVCNAGVCEAVAAVTSAECRPVIEVEFPPRAATLQSASSSVTVIGTVSSAAGPIASLRINDEDVLVEADGSFAHDVIAQVGGNILELEVVDALDVSRKRVQSFLWSPSYHLPTAPDVGILEDGL